MAPCELEIPGARIAPEIRVAIIPTVTEWYADIPAFTRCRLRLLLSRLDFRPLYQAGQGIRWFHIVGDRLVIDGRRAGEQVVVQGASRNWLERQFNCGRVARLNQDVILDQYLETAENGT